MDVCEECHKRDQRVVKCSNPVKSHLNVSHCNLSYVTLRPIKCEICGKEDVDLYFCHRYGDLMRN